jgi:hypothetical protein
LPNTARSWYSDCIIFTNKFLKITSVFYMMSYQRCPAFQWDLQNISMISRGLIPWSKNCTNLSSVPCTPVLLRRVFVNVGPSGSWSIWNGMKKKQCQNQSGTRIKGPSPVPA